jgi:hypothetical protein
MNADALKKLTTESLNQLAALLPIDDAHAFRHRKMRALR